MSASSKLDPRRALSNPWIYEGFQRLVGKDRLRRRFVEEYVHPAAGQAVLDIGCGPGDLLRFLPDVDYVGFDIHAPYVDAARDRFGDRGTFVAGDLEDVREAIDRPVDLVVMVGVLHHVDDREAERILDFSRSLLAPGGRCVALEPHLHRDQNVISRRLILADAGEHVRRRREYEDLCTSVFGSVSTLPDQRMLRVPYSVLIFECARHNGE